MTLGQAIQYYRKRQGLSQEALAELVGVSRQAVSKWELDDATPEVAKLKALAAVFGITVDQLLSEEIPTPPSAEEPEPTVQEFATTENVLNSLPGFLGRLFRKYGWLAGVYIALSGLGTTVVGALARILFSRFFNTAGGMMSFGNGRSFSVTDGMGNLSQSELNQLMGQLGMTVNNPADGFSGIFLIFANAILIIGLLTTLAGVILALYLRKKGQD